MRLKKGFGSVKKLSGNNRRNPYAVYPPKKGGSCPKAICYTPTREIGICCLNAWHNGKYYKGMELDLKERSFEDVVGGGASTFSEVYKGYWSYKYGENAPKTLSKSSRGGTIMAWNKMESIWYKTLDEVGLQELQEILNRVAKKYSKSTVEKVKTLIKGLYDYAIPREMCRKDLGRYIETPKVKDEVHHDAFTDEEIGKLWEAATPLQLTDAGTETGVAQMILSMIYSGFRIGAWRPHGEYQGMKVENGVFIGGVKTDAGKNRSVPIHSAILSMVEGMNGVYLCGKSESQFRRDMKTTLEAFGIRPLTPHSCRHTFHRLLEKAGVGEADRKRLMGHSLKGDVTNGVYGHRSVEELRECVEKIEVARMDIAA